MMRRPHLLLLACSALLVACGPRRPLEVDLEAPYVVSITPSGNAVPIDATIKVRFSEPVRERTIFWPGEEDESETYPDGVALGLATDEKSLKSAVGAPPLSASQREKVLPAQVEIVEGGTVVRLRPLALLEPLTTYVLVLSDEIRDQAGNKIATDETGKKKETQVIKFTTSSMLSCSDTRAPIADEQSVLVELRSSNAVVRWSTDEPGSSEVHFAEGDADFLESSCADSTDECRVASAPASACDEPVRPCSMPDDAPFLCGREVMLTGLRPATTYSFRIVSKDMSGNVTYGDIRSFTTEEPPVVVISEIFATPQGLSDPNEGKFVEIFNGGDEPVDLAGWGLARCAESACTSVPSSPWTFRPLVTGGSLVLAPGAYAVAGGDKFNPAAMKVPDGTLLLRGSTTTLISNTVSASTANSFALVSVNGEVVSTYRAHLGTPNTGGRAGKSFERKDPLGPDTVDNWLLSTAAIASAPGNFATPGRPNSATVIPPDCSDEQVPIVDEDSISLEVSGTSVTVSWMTDEPGRSRVEYVAGDSDVLSELCDGGEEGCLVAEVQSASCSQPVDVCALSNPPAFVCTRTVTIDGLAAETTHTLRLISYDQSDNHAVSAPIEFVSGELPKIVLNELFATPQGFANANDGKFIELYNAGSIDVDLAGWSLHRCTEPTCTTLPASPWKLRAREDGGPTVLPAGQYAVVGGDAFDASLVPEGTLVLKGSSSTLVSNGVVAGTAYSFALAMPDGTLMSSYGAHLGVPSAAGKNGRSFERKDVRGPDTADNWQVSTAEVPGKSGNYATPGAANSGTNEPICDDLSGPQVDAESITDPSEGGDSVTWKTDEGGESVVEYVEGDEAALLDACGEGGEGCLRASSPESSCTQPFDPCNAPDPVQYACTRAVVLTGLEQGSSYSYRLVSRDAQGNETVSEVHSFTVPVVVVPEIRIVLNEIFIAPSSPLTANSGEFVELWNGGEAAVDLSGWKIARCTDNPTASCTDSCSSPTPLAADGQGMTLAPGGYALVTSGAAGFSQAAADALMLKGKPSLRDTCVDRYRLLDAAGNVRSEYGGHLGTGGAAANKGKSFERVDPLEADDADNWARSTAEIEEAAGNFATPGAPNSASL